jgi:hypothetical protein
MKFGVEKPPYFAASKPVGSKTQSLGFVPREEGRVEGKRENRYIPYGTQLGGEMVLQGGDDNRAEDDSKSGC